VTSGGPAFQGDALHRAALEAVVEVVPVELSPTAGRLAGFWHWLDDGERARAGAFRREADRVRYITAHGELRRVLAACLGLEPRALRFKKGASGKPLLDGDPATRLQFSLSHSGDLGLIATCRSRPVGVDLERVRPGFDPRGIAERYFSLEERARLRGAGPDTEREFFRLWTRKEALWKAQGLGLAAVDGKAGPVSDCGWVVRELEVAPGYAAAVCAPGSDWTLRCARPGGGD
jgi:4'-phosphopantetheinyl transferase